MDWIITAVGLTGFFLAGRKVWWCWYINIACQGLWIFYALNTKQYGFLAGAFVYTVVFTINAVKWTADHRRESRIEPDDDYPTETGLGKWYI